MYSSAIRAAATSSARVIRPVAVAPRAIATTSRFVLSKVASHVSVLTALARLYGTRLDFGALDLEDRDADA